MLNVPLQKYMAQRRHAQVTVITTQSLVNFMTPLQNTLMPQRVFRFIPTLSHICMRMDRHVTTAHSSTVQMAYPVPALVAVAGSVVAATTPTMVVVVPVL